MRKWGMSLGATVALAGCVTQQPAAPALAPEVAAKLEANAYALVVDAGFPVAVAEEIAKDCPSLKFNEALSEAILERTGVQVAVMFGGNEALGRQFFAALERKSEAQIAADIEDRLLAFIKSRDYLPGVPATACRVGVAEQRAGTEIGKLLLAE